MNETPKPTDSNSVEYPPDVIPTINRLIDANQLNYEEINKLNGLTDNQKRYLNRTSRYLDRISGAYYSLKSIEYRKQFRKAIPVLESLGGVFKSELADFIIKLADDGNKLSPEIFYVGSLYYSFIGSTKGEILKRKLVNLESE